MRQFSCLEPIKVQTHFDFNENPTRDFITHSKSIPFTLSYLSHMLKTKAGFSAYNICIPQISFAYA